MAKVVRNADELRAGMVLAGDLIDESGRRLLAAGTVLTPSNVRRIRVTLVNASHVFVETKSEADRTPREERVARLITASCALEETMLVLQQGGTVDLDSVEQAVADIVLSEQAEVGVWELLESAFEHDRFLYDHGVAVAGIASVIARWRGLSSDEILSVSLAGYLHDIGFSEDPAAVSRQLLMDEPDDPRVREHPTVGVKLLRSCGFPDEDVLRAIAEHHERNDGSGYPNGLQEDEISVYAHVLAVSDEFHRRTAADTDQGNCFLLRILDELNQLTPNQLETISMKALLDSLLPYYRGREVILSNEERAKIVYIEPSAPCQPIVATVNGPVDLQQETDLSIRHIVET